MKTFHEYEGWQEDLRGLVKWLSRIGIYSQYPDAALRRDRLLAAFREPECGKVLHHADWPGCRPNPIHRWASPDENTPLACREPEGHPGKCVPDVPADAWRKP